MNLDPKAWLWFLSSYAPLWLMLGLRFETVPLRMVLFTLGVLSFAFLLWLLTRRAKERPSNVPLTIVGDAGSEVGGYLATYLLPFLTVARPTWTDLLAYGLFVLVAGLIYTRSGMMQINPTVYLLGRRVLRATVDGGSADQDMFVITQRTLRTGTPLKCERFGDRLFIDHMKAD